MTKELFAEEMTRLYETFNKDFNAKQTEEYYERFRSLSDTQIHELISTALDEVPKFPTRAELVKIARGKNFFEQKVTYAGKSRFVMFECYCGGSIALERHKIETGVGSFPCCNRGYQKPVDVRKELTAAELVRVRAHNAVAHLPANERDEKRAAAHRAFEARREEIRKMERSAPAMCTRTYAYEFVRDHCKADAHGAIQMSKQKPIHEQQFLFNVPTGQSIQQ